MEKILIITGGSKGIGSGAVAAYLKNGYQIYSLARHAEPNGVSGVNQIIVDLTEDGKAEAAMELIFENLNKHDVAFISLINNAGMLGQIAHLENIEPESISKTVTLNTLVPLLLTRLFIQKTKGWNAQKTIVNVSSGAATKPYTGWTVYCATKAALDMMTRTVAAEQEDEVNGVKIIAIYPGVVDTQMQANIRMSNKEDFKTIDRFLALKETGGLATTETVGKQIYAIANDPKIANGSLIHVNDFSIE
ncbi:SDR family NAD(P)-dependent oxidoreductase [Pedobacter sandarakinus]|uniref:SDR family NAD(P)-dependent oxidoreductase n=1 Tax=Pedobacter sandarakinus TaxID=353156 RepID=UPI0022452FD7|nr:SDR family NAD(P)-dependent oxidoreductase [Pedobacter sandarakinus]MCX2573633.1 SDR family NAD(P)-dependent oxidoreductase [Pedobacter sandarakinus]